jgi:hypothetical protein
VFRLNEILVHLNQVLVRLDETLVRLDETLVRLNRVLVESTQCLVRLKSSLVESNHDGFALDEVRNLFEWLASPAIQSVKESRKKNSSSISKIGGRNRPP